MAPSKSLPFPSDFATTDNYVGSLLAFVTSSELFQRMCGGVHILDFLTQDPDLYTALLPEDWRQSFDDLEISDILDLFMRIDLSSLDKRMLDACSEHSAFKEAKPPASLIEYIKHVRLHSLERDVLLNRTKCPNDSKVPLAKHVSVGMKPKKAHEVSNLAKYVDNLSVELSSKHCCQITHFVDFGSGQNYLGRALASPPYQRKVVAIESKPLNIDGARKMDVAAKLAKKKVIMRNKKEYRNQNDEGSRIREAHDATSKRHQSPIAPLKTDSPIATGTQQQMENHEDNIQYIETIIKDGGLSSVHSLHSDLSTPSPHSLMTISLHSCGNLLHHALRSLTLNPSVRAVALVGCCYNLLTERLPPSQTQEPTLRSAHPRLQQISSTFDPHGFPMSERFLKYKHPHGPGIRFNITARMMAVQAPQNWTEKECNSFFTRHFYRALFQKMLVDRGIVEASKQHSEDIVGEHGSQSPEDGRQPIILGSLRKQCYASFIAYVRAAVTKLKNDPVHAERISRSMEGIDDDEILRYEREYGHKKKELSIVWSLMAFSAGVVESAIVVDRWQWLREQEEVKECWVESIFDYSISPRNLVVVGIKG
ncbi:MAG: hypothetical protein Q9170_000582 [Blastenia crenularia]